MGYRDISLKPCPYSPDLDGYGRSNSSGFNHARLIRDWSIYRIQTWQKKRIQAFTLPILINGILDFSIQVEDNLSTLQSIGGLLNLEDHLINLNKTVLLKTIDNYLILMEDTHPHIL